MFAGCSFFAEWNDSWHCCIGICPCQRTFQVLWPGGEEGVPAEPPLPRAPKKRLDNCEWAHLLWTFFTWQNPVGLETDPMIAIEKDHSATPPRSEASVMTTNSPFDHGALRGGGVGQVGTRRPASSIFSTFHRKKIFFGPQS